METPAAAAAAAAALLGGGGGGGAARTAETSSPPRSKSRPRSRKRRAGVALLLAVGALSVALGAAALIWTPFALFLDERLNMRPGLPPYDWWLHPPAVFLRIRLFNVSNGERFLAGEDAKLQLNEVGPIVFMEELSHENVSFSAGGELLTYTAVRRAVFRPDLSAVDPDAQILVPNFAVLGIASYLHDASFITKYGLRLLLRRLRSQPLLRMPVSRYLHNMTDPLLRLAATLAPSLVPVTNLGVVHRIYEGWSDEATVHVGPGSARRFFTMARWRGRERFGWWRDERCDAVAGATEGVAYHQGVRRADALHYFRKTLCRVAPVTYTGDEVREGLAAMRFELPDAFFDRAEDPDADCYAGDAREPLPSGLSDLSPCFFNFPMAASAPHFLNGDPTLLEAVEGLAPDRRKHKSFVVVEPITGIPMESCARIQSNLVIRNLSGLPKEIEKFSNLTLPMFWAEYHQEDLPWYVLYLLYFTVNILPDLQSWLSFIMLACGIGMMAAGIFTILTRWRQSNLTSYKFLDITPSTSSSLSSASS